MQSKCDLCGEWADYRISTGTETMDSCAADFHVLVDTALQMGEPILTVRRPEGWIAEPDEV